MSRLKFGLLGKTLKHSYSKQIHEALGLYEYDLLPVDENELENMLNNREYSGFNVTIPYKQTVIPYCEKISDSAAKIGSVNTVVRQKNGELYGYNTDYDGFSALLDINGTDLCGKRIVILGSGGTFKTVRAVCSDRGGGSIIEVSRRGEHNYNDISAWNDVDVIINTTPVGMYPNSGESLIDLDLFKNCSDVLDVVYNPLKTRLVFDAQERGLNAAGGLYMLVMQAVRACELFMGEAVDGEKAQRIYRDLLQTVKNVVLIGMPGSGKTSIGKVIADRTGRELIDIDEEIARGEGMSIPDIFAKFGEKHFRKLELEYTHRIGMMNGKVISTGGGAVLNRENKYSLAQNGVIFCINREISRLSTDGRPLSKGLDELKKMYGERKELYNYFSDFCIENDGTLEEAADKIMEVSKK